METTETKILRQEIEALRKECNFLRTQINNITKLQDFDRDKTLRYINERFKEMDDYIFPTFHKVFPEFAKTAGRIDTIIQGGVHGGDKHDKRGNKN